jgi:hypothetical protein
MRRPIRAIPTLAQWLDSSDRGEGFEEFAAAILELETSGDGNKVALSMYKTAAVAFIEMMRKAHETGVDPAQVLMVACHVVGFTMFVAAWSRMEEGAPIDKIASIIAQSLKDGIAHAVEKNRLAKKGERG